MTTIINIELIVELLKQTTSLQVVSHFLKEKGLQHSASSWDALYETRIAPAIQNNKLSVSDLIELLRGGRGVWKTARILIQGT